MLIHLTERESADLADAGVAGDQSEVAGAGHVVVAGVVRVDPVGELVLALVAAAVHAGHDLPRAPLPRHPAGRVGGLARHEVVVAPDVGGDVQGEEVVTDGGGDEEDSGENEGESVSVHGGRRDCTAPLGPCVPSLAGSRSDSLYPDK